MRRIFCIALLGLLSAASLARAQVYGTNFDSAAVGTPAESLSVSGLTFSSSPPDTWFVAPVTNFGFASLTGNMLFQPNTSGSLDITFAASVTSCSFVFAMDAGVGQSSLLVQGFSGSTLAGSVTQVTTSAGPFFGEGAINFSPGVSFNRIHIAPADGLTFIAIDDLQATGARVLVTSAPSGMLQAAGSAGATDSYTVTNLGGVPAALRLSQSGSFFTQGPTSFAIAPGQSQIVALTGVAQPAGAYSGTSTILGDGVPAKGLAVPVRLLSATPPTGTVQPRPSASRIDVAAAAGSNPTGSVMFTNTGSGVLTGILVSDVPWLIPQAGIITIPPGGSATVTFSIDRSQRPDAGAPEGTVTGTLSLVYLSGVSGAAGASVAAAPQAGSPAGSVTKVSVNDTVQPPVSSSAVPVLPAGQVALFVPGVGHVQGGSGLFLSDVSFANVTGTVNIANTDLYYTPATVLTTGHAVPERAAVDQDTGAVQKTSLTFILPNQSLAVADLVQTLFATSGQTGSLQVRTLTPDNLGINANIFNVSNPQGTYGTTIPIFRSDRAISAGQTLTLTGLRRDSTSHTNIYVQETAGLPAQVTTTFFDAAGNTVSTRQDSVGAFGLLQELSRVPANAVAARVGVASGSTGKVLAYATPVDEKSGDSWALVDWDRQFAASSSAAAVVPVAGAIEGANNTFFRTDVAITNVGTSSAGGTLRYYDSTGAFFDKTISLLSNQTAVLNDVIAGLFARPSPTVGYLVFTPVGGAFAITSRTYTTVTGLPGTYGTAAPTLALSSGLAAGQSRRIAGVEDATVATVNAKSPGTFRSNFGLIETGGGSPVVRVSILTADGTLLGSKDFPLSAHQFELISGVGSAVLGAARSSYGDLHNIQVDFRVVSGSGAVLSFVSSVDNGSGDSLLRTQ